MTPELPMLWQNTSSFSLTFTLGASSSATATPASSATWRGNWSKGLSTPVSVKVIPHPTYRARNTIRGKNAAAPSFFWFSILFSPLFVRYFCI